MSKRESQFGNAVVKELKKISKKEIWFFKKEARSIRGIPDIIGCYNGHFFAMELKRNHDEASKNHGRIVLQKYTLRQLDIAGGFGYIVHPENLQEVLEDLKRRCSQKLY